MTDSSTFEDEWRHTHRFELTKRLESAKKSLANPAYIKMVGKEHANKYMSWVQRDYDEEFNKPPPKPVDQCSLHFRERFKELHEFNNMLKNGNLHQGPGDAKKADKQNKKMDETVKKKMLAEMLEQEKRDEEIRNSKSDDEDEEDEEKPTKAQLNALVEKGKSMPIKSKKKNH
jgi:hypothetical protein